MYRRSLGAFVGVRVVRSIKATIFVMVIHLILAASAWAAGPWSLFGDAGPVREGLKPNSWAVELVSKCPAESTNCLADGRLTYSGVSFKAPNKRLTFRNIGQLSTSYKIKEWDCGGGSPRFAIGIDTDGDGKVNGHVFVYIGPPPSFSGCNIGVWQNTGNLMAGTDARFDITQLVPQTPYMTAEEALATLGDLSDKPALYVTLVADGGWLADQVVLVDNVRVDNFRLIAKGFGKK